MLNECFCRMQINIDMALIANELYLLQVADDLDNCAFFNQSVIGQKDGRQNLF